MQRVVRCFWAKARMGMVSLGSLLWKTVITGCFIKFLSYNYVYTSWYFNNLLLHNLYRFPSGIIVGSMLLLFQIQWSCYLRLYVYLRQATLTRTSQSGTVCVPRPLRSKVTRQVAALVSTASICPVNNPSWTPRSLAIEQKILTGDIIQICVGYPYLQVTVFDFPQQLITSHLTRAIWRL